MACTYAIIVEENLVVRSFDGVVTTRCILDLIDKMMVDPNYTSGMRELDDMRAVSALRISNDDMKQLADLLVGMSHRNRRCSHKVFLTSGGKVRRAVMRFAEIVGTQDRINIAVVDHPNGAFDSLEIVQPDRLMLRAN